MTQDGQTRGEPDDEVARAIMEHKQAERKQAYARRRAHRRSRTQAGERCAALLDGSALLGGVRTAACYVSMGTVHPICAPLPSRGTSVRTPRCANSESSGIVLISVPIET